jgi:hypothetical protein
LQTTFALPTVLVTEHATLAGLIAPQSVRTEQPRALLVNRPHGLFVGYRSPNQPVDVFHRLDLRFDNAHLTFTIPLEALSSIAPIIYNTVVLAGRGKNTATTCDLESV